MGIKGRWKQNALTVETEKVATVCDRICKNSMKTDSGCWEWRLFRNTGGYGYSNYNYKSVVAHKLSYAAFNGPIPKDTIVRHKCNNPACVNPNHLELGTQWDNVQDQKKAGTWTSPLKRRQKFIDGVPVCQKRNHPLLGDNIRKFSDGKIACRECHRIMAKISSKKRHDRLKALRESLADSQQAAVKEK